MKWKSPSERAQFWLVAPIVVPATILLAICILPLVPIFWLWGKWDSYRFAKPWHRWFAWRPVKLGAWYEKDRRWVWLEMIERVRDCSASDRGWLYRAVEATAD